MKSTGIMYPVAKHQSSSSKKRHYGALPPLRIAHIYLKPATEFNCTSEKLDGIAVTGWEQFRSAIFRSYGLSR